MTIQRFNQDKTGLISVRNCIAQLSFGLLDGKVVVWCFVDPLKAGLPTLEFIVKQTGDQVSEREAVNYVRSFADDKFEWHIFQKISELVPETPMLGRSGRGLPRE